jgi:hypothetical protein
MRRGAALLLVLPIGLAGAGCTAKGIDSLPPPPTTLPRPPTTAPVDFSAIGLKDVPGKTTTTVLMGPGRTILQGSVVGPDGAVPGAVVRAERLVGDGTAMAQVVTAADGTWSMPGVLGGRFRVRAWRASDLALTKPEVFYVTDGDTKQLQLRLSQFSGVAVTFAIAPNPPVVGEPANLVVQVVQQSVDAEGVVRGVPIPNVRADLFGGGDWTISTANPTGTDNQGRAHWQVRCRSEGKQQLAVIVGDSRQFPLDIAACVAAPPEIPEETTTSSSTSSTTSTTVRPGSSTTSTTR